MKKLWSLMAVVALALVSLSARADDTTTVWQVPIGKSPVRGPKNAPVTLVVFSDFQCPFCKKLAPTLDELRKAYPNELRVVFKHNPLPFHARAEPAAELTLEALQKRGEAGFWQVHDALFARDSLDDAALEEVAKAANLDPQQALAAVQAHKYQETLDRDADLALDVDANGTPTSFVNGRKIVGSRGADDFKAVIDEEIVHAKELVAKGTPAAKVYETIVKGGKTAPPAKQIKVAAPTANSPGKGQRGAPVTIQMFTDFQCPFCGKVQTVLAEIEKRYKGRVRIVYRNMPLAMHANARSAANLAMEAFAQKGEAGFWKMHDVLFANQKALERADLLGYAQDAGLDLTKAIEAVDQHRHDTRIEADLKAASDAGISGTPTFVINDYELVGAQPFATFRRVIDRALADKKR